MAMSLVSIGWTVLVFVVALHYHDVTNDQLLGSPDLQTGLLVVEVVAAAVLLLATLRSSRSPRFLKSKTAPTHILVPSWTEFSIGLRLLNWIEKFRVAVTPPSVTLMDMAGCFWYSTSLYAAAKMCVADLVHAQFPAPVPVDDLAAQIGCHPDDIYRLLRALSTKGVFAETSLPGPLPSSPRVAAFAQTPLSDLLRNSHPHSMWGAVVSVNEEQAQAFGKLPETILASLRTGPRGSRPPTGFELAFNGQSFYEYLDRHPVQSKLFDEFMKGVSNDAMPVIAKDFDFSPFTVIVDVGGGDGGLLRAVYSLCLRAKCKKCRSRACDVHQGILFDRQVVVSQTTALSSEWPGAVAVSGSFFDKGAVPQGDLLVLKEILHNWGDEECVSILQCCASSLLAFPSARIAVIDIVLDNNADAGSDPLRGFKSFLDLHMLSMLRGRERTQLQFQELAARADLDVDKVIPLRTAYSVVLLKKKETGSRR